LVRSSTGRDAASGTAGVRSSVGGGDGRCEGCSAFRYELFSPSPSAHPARLHPRSPPHFFMLDFWVSESARAGIAAVDVLLSLHGFDSWVSLYNLMFGVSESHFFRKIILLIRVLCARPRARCAV
jgi:hypothetical protein